LADKTDRTAKNAKHAQKIRKKTFVLFASLAVKSNLSVSEGLKLIYEEYHPKFVGNALGSQIISSSIIFFLSAWHIKLYLCKLERSKVY